MDRIKKICLWTMIACAVLIIIVNLLSIAVNIDSAKTIGRIKNQVSAQEPAEMSRGELSDEIRALGIRVEDQYPAVTSILYTLAGAINCGDENRLMTITAEYSRHMVEMLKKDRREGQTL